MKRCDLLVVGGGVIGLSCALQIAIIDRTVRIVIADASTRPGIASRAAAGMLAPHAEFHEDGPLFRMCLASLAEYPAFLEHYAPEVRIHDAGVLVPCHEYAPLIPDLARRISDAIARENPILHGGVLTEAMLVPGGIVDPRALHDALRATAVGMGISFVEGQPVTVEGNTITLDSGATIRARKVLLATGAWSRDLGTLFGVSLEMEPVKGQVVRVAAPDGLLTQVVHTSDVYLAPRPGQGIIIGATMELAGFDERVDRDVVEGLLSAAERFAPTLRKYSVAEAWSGFRPRLKGGMPFIGKVPGREHILVATGHFRNGILLTPITGRLLAEDWAAV